MARTQDIDDLVEQLWPNVETAALAIATTSGQSPDEYSQVVIDPRLVDDTTCCLVIDAIQKKARDELVVDIRVRFRMSGGVRLMAIDKTPV